VRTLGDGQRPPGVTTALAPVMACGDGDGDARGVPPYGGSAVR